MLEKIVVMMGVGMVMGGRMSTSKEKEGGGVGGEGGVGGGGGGGEA